MFFTRLNRKFAKSFTVMLIPHNSTKPVRFHVSTPFLLFLFCAWTGLTVWAGFVANSNVDYWKTKTGNQLLKLKVEFFAQEIKDTREMLEDVYQADNKLRGLLGMNTRKAIIEQVAAGGPTMNEAKDLNKFLTNRIADMTSKDINRQVAQTKKETQQRMDSYREIENYITFERSLYRSKPNMWPTKGGYITSGFGWRKYPLRRDRNEFHSAIDIYVPRGTPVYTTADGVVRLSGWEGGYGKIVVIDHKHSYSTRYAHLDKLKVAAGDTVTRGQIIAFSGNTGLSTGPHLHYEVLYQNKQVNPIYYIAKGRPGRK